MECVVLGHVRFSSTCFKYYKLCSHKNKHATSMENVHL